MSESEKKKVKVGKLNFNKETVKDLSESEAKGVKGGLNPAAAPSQRNDLSCRQPTKCRPTDDTGTKPPLQ